MMRTTISTSVSYDNDYDVKERLNSSLDVLTEALKMLVVKMTDVKLTDQFVGHEIAGRENDGPDDRM